MTSQRLLVGTGNEHKTAEIAAILGDLPLVVVSARVLAERSEFPDVEETGSTFEENAALKARAFAVACLALAEDERPRWVLSDDSGLCVDALGGAPGVRSSRYASDVCESPTDGDNNAKLLEQVAAVAGADPAARRARFVCTIAVVEVSPRRDEEPAIALTARGECEGVIIEAPRGDGGFGYDPLFLLPDLGRTFAELSPEEKNRRSHRARALEALREKMALKLHPR